MRSISPTIVALSMLTCSGFCLRSIAQESTADARQRVFSGPLAGEQVEDFQVRHALGPDAGKSFHVLEIAGGEPMLIVFVHEVTRPSIGLTRSIVEFAVPSEQSPRAGHARTDRARTTRGDRNDAEPDRGEQRRQAAPEQKKQKSHAAVILLSSDPTETEAFARRARHALPTQVPVGISLDGIEGPGALGLNRNVTLTVLVVKDNTVTANFALVQPSLSTDALAIAKAVAQARGDATMPTLGDVVQRGRMRMDAGADNFRALLSPVIQRDATEQQVDQAAAAVEKKAKADKRFRTRLGQTARRIIQAGRLENYGTKHAQVYIKKWSEQYGGGENR